MRDRWRGRKEVTTDPAAERRAALPIIFTRAADRIRRDGWARRPECCSPKADAPVCMTGALVREQAGGIHHLWAGGDVMTILAIVLQRDLKGRYRNRLNAWNDRPERTAEDVITVLEGAARWARDEIALREDWDTVWELNELLGTIEKEGER